MTVVREWPKSELAEHCDDLLLLLTGAIQDPKDFVRAAAREALCAFAETWSEGMEQLAEIPPLPQRPMIIAEHASAQLTAALLKKQVSATSVADLTSAFRYDASCVQRRPPPRGKRGYVCGDYSGSCCPHCIGIQVHWANAWLRAYPRRSLAVVKTMLCSVCGLMQWIYTWATSYNVDTPSQGVTTA
ncbi:hypothetical protein H257_00639 [Aphanomyces astaci]|uniref:CLASP N-terminal domain-containing protein n=1 Tax=Aphanomyces astaci TaxID=112090 RepID=W4HBB6_APHAT|nr:hypothetical protein H257_00639 [Aphanomyces astaci]ETV89310.1 hypothetical protein H257_00639 [Aphanomyces astaci]|eukprot:XP_009821710.1 hypothetical protein H257_00639 [Aphanomyces astaci]